MNEEALDAIRTFPLVCLFLIGILVPQVSDAQSAHVASQAAIDAALQQKVDSTDADRARVLQLLERPEVREVARESGIDLRRAQSAVATLSPADLAAVMTRATAVEESLAGGQSRITISTTFLIIGLLLLIVLILALK